MTKEQVTEESADTVIDSKSAESEVESTNADQDIDQAGQQGQSDLASNGVSANNTNAVDNQNENMASSQPEPRPVETEPASVATASPGQAQPQIIYQQPPKSGGSGLGVVALLCSLVAMGGAGYLWYQLGGSASGVNPAQIEQKISAAEAASANAQQAVDDIGGRVSSAETKLVEGLSEVKQLVSTTESGLIAQIGNAKQLFTQSESGFSDQLHSIKSSVSTDIQGFRDEFSGLSTELLGMKSEISDGLDSWTLREAAHLILIGNQRLQLAQDVSGARQALTLADQQLAKVSDPELLTVRQTLASEISSLDSIGTVDVVGTTNAINQLANALDQLPIVGADAVTGPVKPKNASGGDANSEQEDTTGNAIVNIGRSFFADLGSMIQVERGGKPLSFDVTPEIKQMIITKGKLILEGAQVALLRQQSEIYLDRLNTAEAWVSQHFKASEEHAQAWLNQLAELKQVNPSVDLPDISGSLTALNSKLAAEG